MLELDGQAVPAKVAAMPIYQWQPKVKNAHVKHYGPMAQDFHAAICLGDDDKMVGMQDADGVALAAIKELNAKVTEQVAQLAEERAARQAQTTEIAELKHAVEVLLARTSPQGRIAGAR